MWPPKIQALEPEMLYEERRTIYNLKQGDMICFFKEIPPVHHAYLRTYKAMITTTYLP